MLRNLFDHPAFLLILVVLVVVIFGAKRLPDAARSLGRSMRIFKTEVKEMKQDDKPAGETAVRPLEGRVVSGEGAEPPAARTSGEQLSDAEAAARYRESQRHSA